MTNEILRNATIESAREDLAVWAALKNELLEEIKIQENSVKYLRQHFDHSRKSIEAIKQLSYSKDDLAEVNLQIKIMAHWIIAKSHS